jgi:hypothetical protein
MWTIIGLIAVIFILFVFLDKLGKTIPLLEFMLLISGLQWIVGPIIEYNTPYEHYKYYMYVPENEYMQVVVPAFLVYAGILLFAAKQYPLSIKNIENLGRFAPYGVIFLSIGVIAQIAGSFVPGTLKFFMVILSNFKYIGAIILFFSDKPGHKNFFYGALVLLIVTSLQSGFFHDLILWSVFFFFYWAIKIKPTFAAKLAVIGVGLLMITIIQGVKMQFRDAIQGGYDGNKLELFVSIFLDQYEGGYYDESENIQGFNSRLNQGWIISAVIKHVPIAEDYANGETVREAIAASILPRFLNPDKKEAGGRENFMRFSGLLIGDNTSMGISVIGEFYANYGDSAYLAMAVWALFLLLTWRFLYKRQESIPFIIFFVPLLFLQVVKAETELVVVLNHLVKSAMVLFGFLYFTKRYLKWSIYNEEETA